MLLTNFASEIPVDFVSRGFSDGCSRFRGIRGVVTAGALTDVADGLGSLPTGIAGICTNLPSGSRNKTVVSESVGPGTHGAGRTGRGRILTPVVV